MRIRLKERCHFAGRLYEPGEELILPDGMRGPHRAVQKSLDRIDYSIDPAIDANRILGEVEDVPLYDIVDEDAKDHVHTDEQQRAADEAATRSQSEPAPAVEIRPEPAPVQLAGAVRSRTHIEEREGR